MELLLNSKTRDLKVKGKSKSTNKAKGSGLATYILVIFILIAIGVTPVTCVEPIKGSIQTITPQSVNSLASLTFNFQFTQAMNASATSYMIITFPSGFSIGSATCQGIYGFQNSSACSANSSQSLKMTGLFPDSDVYTLLQVNSVKLPSYVGQFSIAISVFSASNTLIGQSTTLFSATTLPGGIIMSMKALGSSKVGDITGIQFTITSGDSIPKNGSLKVTIPKWNPGTQNLNNVQSLIQYSTVTDQFNVTEMGYIIDCFSASNPNILCTFAPTSPLSVNSIVTSFDVLTVTGFASDAPAGSQLSFQLGGTRFRNPPSTKAVTSISASTYTASNQIIDILSGQATYQATVAASIAASQVLVSAANKVINAETTYDFSITLPLPLPVGASFVIQVPTQISIQSSGIVILNSAQGQAPLYSSPQLAVTDVTNQIVELTNLVPSSQYYVDEGVTISFTLFNLQNPISCGPTDGFIIQVYDQESLILVLPQTAGVSITATSGTLSNLKIQPDSFRTSVMTSYYFSFVTSNFIPSRGQVQIIIPLQITVQSSLLAFSGISSSKLSSIGFNSSTRAITITNCFTGLPSGSLVSFSIGSGLANPASVRQSSTFTVSTLDSSGNIIDSNSTMTITAAPNEIPSVLATPVLCQNGGASETSEICTYQLRVNISQSLPILVGSSLEVDIPQEIGLPSQIQVLTSASYTEGVQDSYVNVTFRQPRTVIFSGLFSSSSSATIEYAVGMFSIYIANLQTPRSTQPTSTFKVRIYDSQGYMSYKKESLIQSIVSQAQEFEKAVIVRSSQTNGVGNVTYDFTLNTTLTVYKGEYIKITPPSSIQIQSGQNQCQGVIGLSSVLSCSVSNSSLFIMVIPVDPSKQFLPAGTLLRFTVSNIVNPLSTEPTSSFQIFTATSPLYSYYVNQITNGLSQVNQIPGLLTNVIIQPDSQKLGVIANYSIYFTTTNPLAQGTYFQVSLPPQYPPLNTTSIACQPLSQTSVASQFLTNQTTCNAKLQAGKVLIQVYNYPYQISSGNGGMQIGIKLYGIKNPFTTVQNGSSSFIISTMSQNGYLIDQTQNLNYSIGCQFPCGTCQNSQTQCSSCQSSGLSQLLLYGTTCGSSCPSMYFGDSVNTCKKCSYPCQNCFMNGTHCTQCQKSSQTPYLNLNDQKCYSQCPSGYFSQASTSTCEDCSSSCLECALTPDTCTKCPSQQLMWSSKCFKVCPNTTVPLISVSECQSCSSPCQTCSISRGNCTSCQLQPKAYFLYNHQCVESCPKTYLPNDSNVCVKSDEPIYPFLSFIPSGIVLAMILISYKIYPNTRLFSAYLGLQSPIMFLLWVYLIVFLIKDKHWSSTFIVGMALLANLVINFFWYSYYRKKILQLDNGYRRYIKEQRLAQCLIVFLGFVTTFQIFRLQYSRLFNLSAFSLTMDLKEKFQLKLNRYSLLQLTLVYLPVLLANIYNLVWTWEGRQVFWIDIETIALGVIVGGFNAIVTGKSEKGAFVQDAYEVTKDQDGTGIDHTQVIPHESMQDSHITSHEAADGPQVTQSKPSYKSKHSLGINLTDSNSVDDFEEGNDELEKIGQRHRFINDKQYVTLGSLNHNPNKLMNDAKVLNAHTYTIGGAIRGDNLTRHRIDSLGSAEHNPDSQGGILEDLEYTSAPLNVEGALKNSSPARRKFNKFQKELDSIIKKADSRKKKRSTSRSPSKNVKKSPSPKKATTSRSKSRSVERKQRKSPIREKKELWNTAEERTQENNFSALKQPMTAKNGQQTNNTKMLMRVEDEGVLEEAEILRTTTGLDDAQVENEQPIATLGVEEQVRTSQTRVQIHDLENPNIYFKNTEDVEEGGENGQVDILDPELEQALKQELIQQSLANDQQATDLNEVNEEVEQLAALVDSETTKKEELQVIVDDLQTQVQALLEMFNESARRRQEELAIIEKANFTSDEEDMGITPSTFDGLNQSKKGVKGGPKKQVSMAAGTKKSVSTRSPRRDKSPTPKPKDSKKKRSLSRSKSPTKQTEDSKSPGSLGRKGSRSRSARGRSLQKDALLAAVTPGSIVKPQTQQQQQVKSRSPSLKKKQLTKSSKSKSPSKSPKKKGRSKSKKGKKKRGRKSKSPKRKRTKSKSRKSKSKSKTRSKSKNLTKTGAKVAPMPLHKAADSFEEMEGSSLDDVDGLSVLMTQSEFLNLLDSEAQGQFILGDITDQLIDELDMNPDEEGGHDGDNFGHQAKLMLRHLAQPSEDLEIGSISKRKLREYIKELNHKGREFFKESQYVRNLSQAREEEEEEVKGHRGGLPRQQQRLTDFESEMMQGQQWYQLQQQQHPEEQEEDGILPKTKVKKKKMKPAVGSESQQNRSGGFDAYFNYLPFEKAVIQSNGRTPFTNREMEIIATTQQALSTRQRMPTPGGHSTSVAPHQQQSQRNNLHAFGTQDPTTSARGANLPPQ